MHEVHLADLLTFTRDGEWGNGEPTEGFSPALVVRGTDFERVRAGNLDTLPLRYIRSDILTRKTIAAGDTLIETAGGTKDQPTGRSVFIPASVVGAAGLPMVCASFARFLRPDPDRVDPQFLFWKLQDEYHSRRMMPYHVQHTGVARFQYTQFAENYPFSMPSLTEQRAIATTLGALDDKIELNRKMNATLEAMARALFRDWFVDFGPTRAKMEGRAPYLSPDLWSLFPDRLDDEGKPEGWEVRPLVDCFDLLMGQSPPGDTYNDSGDGLPFFQGRTDFGFRFPENRKYCSAPTRVAETGDTLVSVRAPVGDINCASERCCIGRGVAALRHKAGGTSFTYYTAWSLQEELRQYENTGTVFGAINKKQFEKLLTIDPGPAVIEAFEGIASALDSRIDNNERESRTLAQTRDLLLPRLMSGELRVAGAERLVGEVA
jgi:type I restriction enzyme S subunit